MKSIRKIIFISLFFYFPFTGNAWGVLGHRIVGQIADGYLTAKTKTAIQKILGFESVAMASNWPDFIKSDPAYKYLSQWHYVNFESGQSYQQMQAFLKADTATDAFTKVNFMVNELKKNKLLPQDMKVLYLRMLIHVIGDLHQPMHLGRPDDRGGNAIKLTWFNNPVNLHQVWDEKLIDFQQLSYTEYAAVINHPSKEQLKTWQKRTFSENIWDTYALTEKVYAETKANDNLDYLYNFKFVAAMNEQLLKGGVHLASVLNDIFK